MNLPTQAMGADVPLAVLSEKHQPLFNYFKQMFAQVTNPPIDSIREKTVVDTTIYVGTDGNLLEEEGVVFKTGITAEEEQLRAQYDTVVSCTAPNPKRNLSRSWLSLRASGKPPLRIRN